MSTKTKDPCPAWIKAMDRAGVEISVSKILRRRMEFTLGLIEDLTRSGQTIAEGAHELAFRVQNQAGDVPPGATALPGLATALYDIFEKIDKALDCLKEEIEDLVKVGKEVTI